MSVRVLYVCTANICRSPSAEHLLRGAAVAVPGLARIRVRSAGTAAVPGAPGCSVAPALTGHAQQHHSSRLTREHVDWASLILTADRDHRRAVLELAPRARSRTFTIRQAGRIATWLVESEVVAAAQEHPIGSGPGGSGAARFPESDPRRDVPALPADLDERWAWVVTEMEAARGLAGAPGPLERVEASPAGRFRLGRPRGTGQPQGTSPRPSAQRIAGSASVRGSQILVHPDDVPDPHVLGMALHELAFQQITEATEALVRLLRAVAEAP